MFPSLQKLLGRNGREVVISLASQSWNSSAFSTDKSWKIFSESVTDEKNSTKHYFSLRPEELLSCRLDYCCCKKDIYTRFMEKIGIMGVINNSPAPNSEQTMSHEQQYLASGASLGSNLHSTMCCCRQMIF